MTTRALEAWLDAREMERHSILDDEEDRPAYKRSEYLEHMYEAADMRRKANREDRLLEDL